jgi:hypothetical protein
VQIENDDYWADRESLQLTPPDECVIGDIVIEVGSIWMLFFHLAHRFPATAGVMSKAGTLKHSGFRLLGGPQAGRWVPADYVKQVDKMGPMLESLYRLGG